MAQHGPQACKAPVHRTRRPARRSLASLPAAVPLVRRICEDMGEPFELCEYDRFTPLSVSAGVGGWAQQRGRAVEGRRKVATEVRGPAGGRACLP